MTNLVRTASPRDAVALHGLVLSHAAFEQAVASLSVGEIETILAADERSIHLLVAENGSALVGYAAVTFDWSLWRASRYGHLDCLYVAATARGRGIGKKLLDAAMGVALAEGVDRLEWQTPAWNGEAIRFYLRAGALAVAKERFAITLR